MSREKKIEVNNHKSIVNLCINIDADHDPALMYKQNANSDLFLCCDLLRAVAREHRTPQKDT